MRSIGDVPGMSSQYTFASRTRRAISWLYWLPKSRTSTVSRPAGAVPGCCCPGSTVPGSSVVSTRGMSSGAAGSGTPTRDTRPRGRLCLGAPSSFGAHAHPLRGLGLLALADDRGRDHHLDLLELT